jgi:O-antigen ligase
MLVFTAAAFALPGEAAYGLMFYLSVLPAVGWGSLQKRRLDLGVALALSLIAWSGLTLLWGEDPGHRALGFAFAALCTAAFVVALKDTFSQPVWVRRWTIALICAGTINAAWSLLLGLPSLLAGDRIFGWGITRQPILGGSVMALAYVTALFHASERACTPRRRLVYVAAAAIMAVFVLAMQSRGALLAATGGTLLLLAASPWRWRAGLCLMGAAVAWSFVVPASLRQHASRLLTERGTSHRFEIWRVTWALIRQKPVFGYGIAANVPPSPTGFPHSLVLSLLFYSGTVGLLLFLMLAGLAARRLFKAPPGPERAWIATLCATGLLAGLTDLGQITKGPGPIWFIIWVPLMLALSIKLRATASGLPAQATPLLRHDAARAAPPVPRTLSHDRDGADAPPHAPPRNPAPKGAP